MVVQSTIFSIWGFSFFLFFLLSFKDWVLHTYRLEIHCPTHRPIPLLIRFRENQANTPNDEHIQQFKFKFRAHKLTGFFSNLRILLGLKVHVTTELSFCFLKGANLNHLDESSLISLLPIYLLYLQNISYSVKTIYIL